MIKQLGSVHKYSNVLVKPLTHLSLASFLWNIDKQNSPRCDAAERAEHAASRLGLLCLLREFSSKK